jgi:Tol biopolymer transport system component
MVGQLDADTAQNIYALPAAGGALTSLIRGPLRDVFGRFSGDGKWFLYASEDTGQFQLLATTFPTPSRPVRISQAGATFGWWSKDNREIAYVDNKNEALWKVDVTPGPTLQVSAPRKLATLPPGVTFVEPTRDLQKFLVVMPERTGPGSITLVERWRAALDVKR